MPKKYKNRALLTKPTSSAPSNLASTKVLSTNNNGENARPTVNELIRESRRSKGEASSVNVPISGSVPPSVRIALNMPAPDGPPPRAQLRGPARLRRIPGPPPPQSWLTQSQHAPNDQRLTFSKLRWLRARIQQQASTLPGIASLPNVKSLEHLIYTRMATDWNWHAFHDHTYLSVLPVSSRMTLLSYLAVYHEFDTSNPLPLLFPQESDPEELAAVTRLDLTNSLGTWATMRKVEKELLMIKDAKLVAGKAKQPEIEVIPESWDDEETQSSLGNAPTVLQSKLRFPNLKHLSLACNPASSHEPPAWGALISLTAHLPGLTSLSLAHWPMPTYTPNAAKGRVKIIDSSRPSVPAQLYGGTEMYTAFDNNWREAAGILRSLSRNLYCLTWLDLSGCVPWLQALTWKDENDVQNGADWNGSWRNLSTLVLAVGWLPGREPNSDDELSSYSSSSIDSTRAIEQLYGDRASVRQALEALASLRLHRTSQVHPPETPRWNVEEERQQQYYKRDVERFFDQQTTAKLIADKIKVIRKNGGAKRIEYDFGEPVDEELLRSTI